MIGELDTLRIVKEDILRILAEKGIIPLNFIKKEIKASNHLISKAIQELKKERLIQSQQAFLKLTEEGEKTAQPILKRHLVIEDYFKKTRSGKKAHQAAHILEHYIFKEVSDNIKKLSTLKKQGVPLIKVRPLTERLIVNITVPESGLFERIISMGIFPGREIWIINKIPGGLIVKVNSNKFALDQDLAKNIKVVKIWKI